MVKLVKALFFALASVVMAVCTLFVPESAGAVSIPYITVIGLYLGLDIAGMITKTSQLPKGEYKTMKVHKYVISAVGLLVNIVIAIIMRDKADISTAMTSFLSATMIILGCIIGGLEGNRIAASVGEEATEESTEDAK
jgi:uncharacterized protein YacL